MLLRDGAFFYSGSPEQADAGALGVLHEAGRAARKLAKHYGQSPLTFLDLPIDQIWRLWDDTIRDIDEDRLAAL